METTETLALGDHLLTSVLGEAKMCFSGEPVILMGDLNADLLVIPSLHEGTADWQR